MTEETLQRRDFLVRSALAAAAAGAAATAPAGAAAARDPGRPPPSTTMTPDELRAKLLQCLGGELTLYNGLLFIASADGVLRVFRARHEGDTAPALAGRPNPVAREDEPYRARFQGRSGGGADLSASATPRYRYRVEVREDFSGGAWARWGTAVSSGAGIIRFDDASAAAVRVRCYRLVVED